MKTISLLAAATLASATLASSAHAHINATLGDATGRNGNQKSVPCDGDPGTGPVLTYEPGTTVTLTVNEQIAHPGYFRVAFDADGQDFMDPRSIDPVERSCQANNKFDKCGESDFCNNETVLWDNLAPHGTTLVGGKYVWKIKLPDVECEGCTLQVIQVMEDDLAHGPYCSKDFAECKGEPNYVEDNYHRCFDIKLKKGATNGPGASKDAVSLPADKKYVDCSKQSPGEPSQPTDAGKEPEPTQSDAGVEPGEDSDESNADDDDTSVDGETGSTKPDASVKKDAGVRKDAGKASSDDEDDRPGAASKEEGCALASTSDGALWTLLALGGLLALRRRRT